MFKTLVDDSRGLYYPIYWESLLTKSLLTNQLELPHRLIRSEALAQRSALILEFSKPLGPSSHKPKVQEGTIREILRVKEKGLQLSYLYFSHPQYDVHHVFPFYHFTNRIGPPVLGSLWTGGAWHGSGWRLTSGAGWWPKKPRRSCSRSDGWRNVYHRDWIWMTAVVT